MINEFKGENYFLSNFSHSRIEMNGLVFNNAEAAFHSHKNVKRAKEFVGLNPSAAKKLGRKVELREDWEEVKDHIMYNVIVEKFKQNLHFQEKLLATANKQLIEGNTWNDKYWGVCNGEGENMLGRILELTRNYLKNQTKVQKLIDEQEEDIYYETVMEILTPPETGE